jgi:uncharacterized DUF497 family protein
LEITGFIWLEEIIDKLAYKHRVRQQEVREVFGNRPRFHFVEKGHRPNENVYVALGQTDAGRYLAVYFVYRRDKQALILSARNMTTTERRRYEQN